MSNHIKKYCFLGFIIILIGILLTMKDNAPNVKAERTTYYGQGLTNLEHARQQFSYHGLLTLETLTFVSGETLARKLNVAGIKRPVRTKIIGQLKPVFALNRIRPGEEIYLLTTTEEPKQLISVKIPLNKKDYLQLNAEDDFLPQEKENLFTRKVKHVDGIINSSFYASSLEFNIPTQIFIDYIRIMSFDISFQQDVRKNTEFSILYEELYDNKGVLIDSGNILKGEL